MYLFLKYLDCKEIQPVHSKGDQSWVFFGGNDAKAETPILWPIVNPLPMLLCFEDLVELEAQRKDEERQGEEEITGELKRLMI